MNNGALEVERDPTYLTVIEASRGGPKQSVADGIVSAAREIAETADIKVICCYSQSGKTALLVARERPTVPIIAMTSLMGTARRLSLTWGLHCVKTEELQRFKTAVVNAARAARTEGFAEPTDQLVVTAGVPFGQSGTTNILRVAPCDERLIIPADPE
ncbi:MAG: pyruvate kinase, partial [Boseongicola sp.]|nr:pyruvate kinase [Boseongicola sp.]